VATKTKAAKATATTDAIAIAFEIATWWTEIREATTHTVGKQIEKPKLKCCSPTWLRFGVARKKKKKTK